MKANRMSLKIHCLQHVSFEGIGYIETWANKNNHKLTFSHLYKGDPLPALTEFDWLIIMGGPMNIYEEEKYPWLIAEKQFIKESIKSDKTVLGFCLGSQLIADVLGAKVSRNKEIEIGWFPISLTKAGEKNLLFEGLDVNNPVFHWHGDTFDIPTKCDHIASSIGCTNQAFIYKKNVIGFQFHLEVTPESIKDMVQNGKEELVKGAYIQSKSEILAKDEYIKSCNQVLDTILNRLTL
ncbi:GMP synthase-Glutamine amidotransferase [Dysgonomonas macrotermitis]|uniref:GMP synthase-Glutamine amidotransferase n=2 Tax=Dysgonomonas macrotermitis TaxID=1346286 RepID=A0A1M5I5D6_9BACT|nr:GMP synthase-Glutamine amidotransferase [Dysgonomonas macrotermitis]